jgi:uridine kinase
VDARRPLTGPATFDGLAAHVRSGPPKLGAVRLVSVDGPAGSGKTTFAERLTDALGDGAALVHLEDLYAGWTLTSAVARLSAGVLRPLAEGRPGSHHRYDWAAGRFADEPVPVPVPGVLVVEGCGSSPRVLDPWTTLRIWVEAPAPLRLSRGLARDGDDLAAHWRRWQQSEARHFAAEDTRARADVRVDGAAAAPPGGFVLLD